MSFIYRVEDKIAYYQLLHIFHILVHSQGTRFWHPCQRLLCSCLQKWADVRVHQITTFLIDSGSNKPSVFMTILTRLHSLSVSVISFTYEEILFTSKIISVPWWITSSTKIFVHLGWKAIIQFKIHEQYRKSSPGFFKSHLKKHFQILEVHRFMTVGSRDTAHAWCLSKAFEKTSNQYGLATVSTQFPHHLFNCNRMWSLVAPKNGAQVVKVRKVSFGLFWMQWAITYAYSFHGRLSAMLKNRLLRRNGTL